MGASRPLAGTPPSKITPWPRPSAQPDGIPAPPAPKMSARRAAHFFPFLGAVAASGRVPDQILRKSATRSANRAQKPPQWSQATLQRRGSARTAPRTRRNGAAPPCSGGAVPRTAPRTRRNGAAPPCRGGSVPRTAPRTRRNGAAPPCRGWPAPPAAAPCSGGSPPRAAPRKPALSTPAPSPPGPVPRVILRVTAPPAYPSCPWPAQPSPSVAGCRRPKWPRQGQEARRAVRARGTLELARPYVLPLGPGQARLGGAFPALPPTRGRRPPIRPHAPRPTLQPPP